MLACTCSFIGLCHLVLSAYIRMPKWMVHIKKYILWIPSYGVQHRLCDCMVYKIYTTHAAQRQNENFNTMLLYWLMAIAWWTHCDQAPSANQPKSDHWHHTLEQSPAVGAGLRVIKVALVSCVWHQAVDVKDYQSKHGHPEQGAPYNYERKKIGWIQTLRQRSRFTVTACWS